jgi:hypothetical protein
MAKAIQRGSTTRRASSQDDAPGRQGPEQVRRPNILVGTPWPDGIAVVVNPPPWDVREGLVIGLSALFGTLLVAFVVYGMIMSHEYILKQAFSLVQYGLGAVGVWTVGRKALQYVSTVSYDESKSAR